MSRLRFASSAAVTLAGLAATSAWVAHGRGVAVTDLPQDYASARAWLAGEPAYAPLADLQPRAGLPAPDPSVMVRANPHPPVAVLLTAPYAPLDFGAALAAVRWTQLAALALAWAACFELFRPAVSPWAWAAAGGAWGLWCPVWQGLAWAQPVGLLALGTVAVWALARAERAFAFGVVLAALTLVRPFAAVHVVLACGWTGRKMALAAAGLAAGGAVPFALLGVTPWEWYRLASDAGGYVSWCGSVPGVLGLGPRGGQLLYAAAAAVLAGLRWRGAGTDAVAALAAVTAMLAYPLAWFQYDVTLIPVVAWVLAGGNRAAVWGAAAYLALRVVPDMTPAAGGRGVAELLARNKDWLQVLARGVLLAAAGAAGRAAARVSASGPS